MIRNRLYSKVTKGIFSEMGSDLGSNKRRESSRSVKPILLHLLTFLVGCAVGKLILGNDSALTAGEISILRPQGANKACEISFGEYRGKEYTTETTVGQPKCLVESKFLKVQQHHVRMGNDIIPDWMWIDYHDRINVLVEAPDKPLHFLVFDQTKYALENGISIAIVGGIIEIGEQPEEAARREVAEEMKVSCSNFHFLGRFRTDVNRGMGWTNSFLATECEKTLAKAVDHGAAGEEVGVADTEKQELRTISLSELREAASAGRFLEIQWSATVALSLLRPELTG